MIEAEENSHEFSSICNYFHGKIIFLTGGTSFIGRLLIEKLLR